MEYMTRLKDSELNAANEILIVTSLLFTLKLNSAAFPHSRKESEGYQILTNI